VKLKYMLSHIDEREVSADTPLMSVSKFHGVVLRSEISDDEGRADDISNYKTCQPDDLVINRMAAYQGALGIAKQVGAISPDYMVLRISKNLIPSYLGYFFKSHWMHSQMSSLVKGIGSIESNSARTPRLSWNDLKNLDVQVPALDEQKAIADFLDRELAQIDAVIDKQGELQELLKIERAIYISTKVFGQNANVAISDMPKLPHGWLQMKLKQVANIQASNVDKKIYEDGNPVSLCNYVDVYKHETINADIDFMQATASAAEIAKFSLRSGQVILTKDSESADDIGIAAFVPNDLPGVVCGYHLSMLTPYAFMDGQFLKYVLDSKPAKCHFARYSNGLTRMALGQGALGALPVPVPPLKKQQELVLEIRSALAAIDAAIGNGSALIAILRERRQSLISAAVTGKLDVRKVA